MTETSDRDSLAPLGFRGDMSRVYGTLDCEMPCNIANTMMQGQVSLGAFSYFNYGCEVGTAQIGRFCSIGQQSMIGPGNHPTNLLSTHAFSCDASGLSAGMAGIESYRLLAESSTTGARVVRPKGIVIGHDVWIGARAIVLSGVTVGDGAIIGAGAVVTKDVAPYTVVGGVPAEVIRRRFPDGVVERMLLIRWWSYDLSPIAAGLDYADPGECLDVIEAAAAEGRVTALRPPAARIVRGAAFRDTHTGFDLAGPEHEPEKNQKSDPAQDVHMMFRHGRFSEAADLMGRFSRSLCPAERAAVRDISVSMAVRHLESGLLAGAAPLDEAASPSGEPAALAAAAALEAAGRPAEAEALFQRLNAGGFSDGTPVAFHFHADQAGRALVRDVTARHCQKHRRPPPVSAPDYSTILLHLNVTGGGALADALGKLYLPWEVRDTSRLAGLRAFLTECETLRHWVPFISWHSGGGWHVPFPADRFRIFTLARHPVSRFVSFYNTLLSHGDGPWVPNCVKQRLGIEALLDHIEQEAGGNSFAKEVCLLEVPGPSVGKLTDALLLELARDILVRRFFLVGITELFEATLAAAALLMGFNRVPFWRHGFTSSQVPGRVLLKELSSAIQARIAGLFALDMVLYQEARERFETDYDDVIAFLSTRKLQLQQAI